VYVAFIFIAAYGVVSRSMTKLGDVQFTAKSIFVNIFYAPYWFLYSEINDEKNALDGRIILKDTNHNVICPLAIISNNTSADLVAGATATHVLLAFHMLFINLLLLNLLIAVFTYVNWVE
jgi:hypothetical protein